MVCPCCDPCRSLCPGVGFPDALVFTISEAVFADGGGYWFDESNLTFALTDSFVLTRGSFCLTYFALLYPQPNGLWCNPTGVFPGTSKLRIAVTFGPNNNNTAFASMQVGVVIEDTEATIQRSGCLFVPGPGSNLPPPIQSCAIDGILKVTTGINFCEAATQGYYDTLVNTNPAFPCNPLRSISYAFEPA